MASTLAATPSPADLQAAMTAQGDLVRSLKSAKADSETISAAVKQLQALKLQIGGEAAVAAKPKKAAKFTLKTPKVRTSSRRK